jgi:hypothetical protein
MPLYLPTAPVVLPEIGSNAQAWGLPGAKFAQSNSTAGFGEAFALFYVDAPITVTEAMIHVTVGPGGDESVLFALFSNNAADGTPGTLLYSFTSLPILTSATGVHAIAGSYRLTPGWYWIGAKTSAYITCRMYAFAPAGIGSDGDRGAGYGAPDATPYASDPTITLHTFASSVAEISSAGLLRWTA